MSRATSKTNSQAVLAATSLNNIDAQSGGFCNSLKPNKDGRQSNVANDFAASLTEKLNKEVDLNRPIADGRGGALHWAATFLTAYPGSQPLVLWCWRAILNLTGCPQNRLLFLNGWVKVGSGKQILMAHLESQIQMDAGDAHILSGSI